ncbi:hypothetical protein D0469_01260 [Peribacillus saganii]|uniref:Uncharacterized protein n=1 Tax=Peribacillus saganii TaxID=2303992 RepID=A0A372LTE7_9BACI|nr:YfmQ family protein [Peribacillus saganii]RFU71495.1 hypothetical protein D0469_01260 [Peribacillus saganii]
MTWTVVISIVIGGIIKFLLSPPSAVVAWILSKFAIHPKLNSEDVIVTFNGKHIEEEEKIRFTDYFNEATFLKKHYIFPGNEKLFLHPETDVIPFVINVKGSKKDVNIFVYSFDDHVDVVKQCKKKVVSYSLSSDYLQNFTISTKGFSKM